MEGKIYANDSYSAEALFAYAVIGSFVKALEQV
jgi:hypothetical protein